MPYKSTDDLPDSVKDNLPTHAQHIFLKAFDNAWQEYSDPSKRNDPDEDQEQTAFRVAWNAVKQEYHKQGDKWVRNS
ncbi:MAG TPA: ChaB family protein [Candidatus Obscuribacterales bacterium]